MPRAHQTAHKHDGGNPSLVYVPMEPCDEPKDEIVLKEVPKIEEEHEIIEVVDEEEEEVEAHQEEEVTLERDSLSMMP